MEWTPDRRSVVSDDGYVVGLCIEDSAAECLSGGPFLPRFAGIPDPIVVKGVRDMHPCLNAPLWALELSAPFRKCL